MSTNVFTTIAKGLSRSMHEGQLYGGRPYSYHIDCVVSKVNFLYGESPRLSELQQVAYLHDILEDTELTDEVLHEMRFAEDVVDAVVAISKVDGEDLFDYYDRVSSNKLAFKVKVADTMSNLEHSCRESQTKRIFKYTKQLQELYARKEK